MGILKSQLVNTGLADAPTNIIWLKTDNTIAEVLVAGYLSLNLSTLLNQLSVYQLAAVYTTDSGTVLLQVTFANGLWSLSSAASAGSVAVPTVANQLAYATNTVGALAAAGITRGFNAGGIDAGLSGTAGTFRSYPATAANGYLEVFGTANGGARNVTVTNVAHGQTSAYAIPDCGNANGRILVGASATPFTTARLLSSSGTGGLVADSGVDVSNVQLKTNVKVAATADIGGGGAGPISVAVAGLTAASFVFPVIKSSSNAVGVAECLATATGFDITFTADPGAACVVNYEAYVVGQ